MAGEHSRHSPSGAVAPLGLNALSQVVLDDPSLRRLELAALECGGDPAWRARKNQEAREILALAQIAPPGRLIVDWIDLRENLRVLLRMRVPVPCRPDARNELRVAGGAVLGLTYPPEAVRRALPGSAFIQILSPRPVWLACVALPEQPLCLGASLPAGVRVRSLVLMAFGALSMQSAQVDEIDPAGVFNAAAARWWQQNMDKVPLSRTPFLAPAAERRSDESGSR